MSSCQCFFIWINLGIGAIQVAALNFTDILLCIGWDKPFVSDDVAETLSYDVLVTGTDMFTLNAVTNHTQLCLEKLTPCQEYTVTVTPFSTSPNYTGTPYMITGEYSGGTVCTQSYLMYEVHSPYEYT